MIPYQASNRVYPQPELTDEWGVTFYGKAETITGDFWWYEQDGKRYPLKPKVVRLNRRGV